MSHLALKAVNQKLFFITKSIILKSCLHCKKFSSNCKNDNPPDPPSPGLCCMTGCANCVWIQHAEKLVKFYKKSGNAKEKILEVIEKEVDDESLKAYLKFEINMMSFDD